MFRCVAVARRELRTDTRVTDVSPKLKEWRAAGKQLAIFSSGSVFAQKLFFTYVAIGDGQGSRAEDLNPLLSAYFDTVNAGPKIVAPSYSKIADELGRKPDSILFLSDNVKGELTHSPLTVPIPCLLEPRDGALTRTSLPCTGKVPHLQTHGTRQLSQQTYIPLMLVL